MKRQTWQNYEITLWEVYSGPIITIVIKWKYQVYLFKMSDSLGLSCQPQHRGKMWKKVKQLKRKHLCPSPSHMWNEYPHNNTRSVSNTQKRFGNLKFVYIHKIIYLWQICLALRNLKLHYADNDTDLLNIKGRARSLRLSQGLLGMMDDNQEKHCDIPDRCAGIRNWKSGTVQSTT